MKGTNCYEADVMWAAYRMALMTAHDLPLLLGSQTSV
jgi:hypothetical protein